MEAPWRRNRQRWRREPLVPNVVEATTQEPSELPKSSMDAEDSNKEAAAALVSDTEAPTSESHGSTGSGGEDANPPPTLVANSSRGSMTSQVPAAFTSGKAIAALPWEPYFMYLLKPLPAQ